MFYLIKLLLISVSISTGKSLPITPIANTNHLSPAAVLAINCYQCNSSSSTDCNELFNAEDTNLKAQSCDHVYEARYCVKTTGIYGGLMGTQRFCSSRDVGNYCGYIKRNGDKREQRSCVYTCSRDACNRSNLVQAGPCIYLLLIFILKLIV